MATKSMEGYKTARLAQMGDAEAQQKLMAETPGFNMMNTEQTYSQPSKTFDEISKDREVEIGLGTSVGPNMSDEEKKAYVDSLTDSQYRQMKTYKNQGYSFEAAKTLLENSDGLANPTAQGKAKYSPKGNFISNVVGGAYDSVTGIPRFIANNVADAIGWTAKQFGADENNVDALVQNYKDYLDSDWSGRSLGANTDSLTYKGSKMVGDLAQTFAYGALGGSALQGTKVGQVMNTVKNSGLAGKMAVGAAEGAADMGVYSVVADSELPSGTDLAVGATLGAAFPMLGAAYKGTKGMVKSGAVKMADELIGSINHLSKAQERKFTQMIGEKSGKWLNDRGIDSGEKLIEYFRASKNKVDDALAAIDGRFTSEELTDVLNDSVRFAKKTKDKEFLNKLMELQNKNAEGGLTMSEINEVKRYFERNNKFTYLTKGTGEQAKRATNMDTALREWQQKVAEENGFNNLAELNKETQAAKHLLDNAYDMKGTLSNNPIVLTDWIVLAEKGITLDGLSEVVAKKISDTPRFRRNAANILNWIGKHETIPEKLADLSEISRINSEKELNAWLKQQEAEYNAYLKSKGVGDTTPKLGYEGPEPATDNRYWQKLRDNDPSVKYEVKEYDSNGKMYNDDPYNVPKDVVEWKPTQTTTSADAVQATENITNNQSDLRQILGDKFYTKLEKDVEQVNKSRRGVNPLTNEPFDFGNITVEDLNLSSDLYKQELNKMESEEIGAIQKRIDELTKSLPKPPKLTQSQQAQLERASSTEEKSSLLKKWQDARLKKNPIPDDIAEELSSLFEEGTEIQKRYKNARDYLYSL